MNDALRYAIGTSLVAGVVLALLTMYAAVRHRGALLWAVYAGLWIAVRDLERGLPTTSSDSGRTVLAVLMVLLALLGSVTLIAATAWHVRLDLVALARAHRRRTIGAASALVVIVVALVLARGVDGASLLWRGAPLPGILAALMLLRRRERWLPRRVFALFLTALLLVALHAGGQVAASVRGAALPAPWPGVIALLGLAGAAGLATVAMYLVVFEQVMRSRRLEATRLARERLVTLGRMSTVIQQSLRGTLEEINRALGRLALRATEQPDALLAHLTENLASAQQQVASLLRYAREYEPRVEQVALGPWLLSAAGRLAEKSGRCRIEFTPPTEAPVLPTDPALVHRILEVLVENAALAQTPEHPIRLEARPTADGARIAIIVSDVGEGIPSALLAELGTPFISGWRTGRHAGLGIAVAHLQASLIDARLSFLPRSGGGTDASLELPLAGPAPAEPGQHSP